MIKRDERLSGGGQKETSFAGGKGGGGVEAAQYVYICNVLYITGTL